MGTEKDNEGERNRNPYIFGILDCEVSQICILSVHSSITPLCVYLASVFPAENRVPQMKEDGHHRDWLQASKFFVT